jgi:hypothetical protein
MGVGGVGDRDKDGSWPGVNFFKDKYLAIYWKNLELIKQLFRLISRENFTFRIFLNYMYILIYII